MKLAYEATIKNQQIFDKKFLYQAAGELLQRNNNRIKFKDLLRNKQ